MSLPQLCLAQCWRCGSGTAGSVSVSMAMHASSCVLACAPLFLAATTQHHVIQQGRKAVTMFQAVNDHKADLPSLLELGSCRRRKTCTRGQEMQVEESDVTELDHSSIPHMLGCDFTTLCPLPLPW